MQWEKTVSNHISEKEFIYIIYKKLLQVNSKIIMIWLENGQTWKCYLLNHVWLFVTPWTTAHQAPLWMKFSRLEYWSGLPFTSPGDLPNPGIEPGSPALQADSLPSGKPPGKPVIEQKIEERWIYYLSLRGDVHLLLPLDMDTPGSQASDWNIYVWHPTAQAFGLELNHTTSFPGSSSCRHQIIEFLNLNNCMSQFL